MKYVTNYLFCNAIYVPRYQCQYGPNDLINVVKDITQNHNAVPMVGHQWKSNPNKDRP